ncbi:MAG TPA: hypothetical protein VJY65_13305 [Chloroflexota bacterium]|nr:hypothetical protein [Chloroflexota bacterium]
MHALRHAAGTRLYAETRDLEATARHLGHSKLERTRIYATQPPAAAGEAIAVALPLCVVMHGRGRTQATNVARRDHGQCAWHARSVMSARRASLACCLCWRAGPRIMSGAREPHG